MQSMLVAVLAVLVVSSTAQCYRATSNALSFRTGAGTNYPKVGARPTLNIGDQGNKVGGPVSNGGYNWINLDVGGVRGWAADQWLTGCGGGGAPPPPAGGGGSVGCAPASSTLGSGGEWGVNPVDGGTATQPYGRTAFSWSACAQWYKAAGCMHNGIDIRAKWGTPVKAVCSGPITSGTDQGGGNPMSAGPKSVVQHCGNWLALYGHMSQTQTGWKNAGDVLGLAGNPGGRSNAGNDHLHFEVRKKQNSATYSSNAVNPLPLFQPHLRGALSGSGIVCGDAMAQPDVIYGQAANCKQWCGCRGYC